MGGIARVIHGLGRSVELGGLKLCGGGGDGRMRCRCMSEITNTDVSFKQGQEVIFRIGLALLEQSQSSLLHMDMEDMLKVSGWRK